ncbi:hypothetical protein SKDZ_13G4260 [Saccharomyces kudriavzevii ZP591]|uniref:Dyn3p n=1 Tax=Saccharomyces cerevisiae x Saccharomyces kudriavzevii (strain VIN7) TaxID=1095631 RepID=H0GZR2_SACCK|nr:Dyn3p [Saccharomyces cerevisiae x Saccharomyces kudriavzevii VIN7]CAI4048961.1 hypothetical protein SKDZ_13G4260 [Saccharomyces kudriavzevii ZP591]
MGNAWDELLAQSEPVTNTKGTVATTAVIHSLSSKTLHQFTTLCFPEGTSSLLDTKLVNFATIGWTNDLEQHCSLDVYTLIKNGPDALNLLKPFLQERSSRIHWLILLDWSSNDQQLWLGELFSTFSSIKQLSDDNEFSVWCLNSDKIFSLQRNTTVWQSAHIDFVLQSLRSFCYFNDSSLFYIDEHRNEEEDEKALGLKYQEILKHAVEGRDMEDYIEMVKRSRISIPKGCDSIGLIKTIDERFEPTEVEDVQFMTRYTNFVPTTDGIKDGREIYNFYDLNEAQSLTSFQVNIQEELGKMFMKHRKNSKISETRR